MVVKDGKLMADNKSIKFNGSISSSIFFDKHNTDLYITIDRPWGGSEAEGFGVTTPFLMTKEQIGYLKQFLNE